METKVSGEQAIKIANEKYVSALEAVIDAIINLEDFIKIPGELVRGLDKVNSLKHYAELEVEAGDLVWNNHAKEFNRVVSVGVLNYETKEHGMVGKKFCKQLGI